MLVGYLIVGCVLFGPAIFFFQMAPTLIAVLAFLLVPLYLLGLVDILQERHAVRRNFPIIGNFRYLFELIRPEIQQYFVEDNVNGRPIPRNIRSVVYQRAKKMLQTQPYGTQKDLYEDGREWGVHTMYPTKVSEGWDRFQIGGADCKKPYLSSRLNISAMSYGSLSSRAIESLNKGAREGGFSHNTGEGGISSFHRMGGDLVWQIGTGYFGCRTKDGKFCEKSFAEKSQWEEVKMVELKLSQGAKPGKGGMLPGEKVTQEIADIRGVEIGKSVLSPSGHSAFGDAGGLVNFIGRLRELCGGKPVGIKLCVGQQGEFFSLVEAMREKKMFPDFITVDGSEGGTGAAPIEFADSMGMPLKDGLYFVHETLKRLGVRDKLCIIASGKSFTGFDMLRNFALGANVINSARGMMLSMGCIQALQCHSNHCPVGIATNNKRLVRGLVVEHKAPRVANYQKETLDAAETLMGAMGKGCPEDIQPEDIFRRTKDQKFKTLRELYGSV